MKLSQSLFAALSVTSLLVSAATAFADNGIPCGKISNGDLSIPGFSLHVTDAQGAELSDLTASGKISIYHSVWEGDHWTSVEKYIAVNVAYQAGSHAYVVAPVSRVELGSSGIFGSCEDVIESYDIEFTNSVVTGQFLITFQNDSLEDAQTRINQMAAKTDIVVYPAGQPSPDQAADAAELEVFVDQLMPYQQKAIGDWALSDLVPFTQLEVQNALARFARVLRIGAMGTAGTDDFKNLSQICSYFTAGNPIHAPELANALLPLTTDQFASDVQNKNSKDKMSDLLSKMIPVCKAAIARTSN